MTIESSPDTSAAQAPAPTPAPSAPSREERRARQIAVLKGADKTALAAEPEAPAASADDAAAKALADATAAAAGQPAESPAAKRLAKVRAAIREQAAKREADLAAQRRDQEHTTLQQELQQLRGRPSLDTFLEEFARAPAETLRKYKLDPAQHLNLLTKDAITPGSVSAESQLEALRKEFLGDKEARAQAEQQRLALEQQQRYEAERAAFSKYAAEAIDPETKAQRWPLLAKTSEAKRIRLAVAKWAELQDEGATEYSRDLVADAVEADLEDLHQSWTPPASPPAQPTPSPDATKKPRTLTPAIAAESGAPRKKPWSERKRELAEAMRRKNAAKDS